MSTCVRQGRGRCGNEAVRTGGGSRRQHSVASRALFEPEQSVAAGCVRLRARSRRTPLETDLSGYLVVVVRENFGEGLGRHDRSAPNPHLHLDPRHVPADNPAPVPQHVHPLGTRELIVILRASGKGPMFSSSASGSLLHRAGQQRDAATIRQRQAIPWRPDPCCCVSAPPRASLTSSADTSTCGPRGPARAVCA